MTIWKTSLAGLAAALFMAACTTHTAKTPDAPVAPAETAEAAPQSRVLMIGIDGLNPHRLAAWDAPNIKALGARGVTAEAMVPVMPTKTYVNFYSLATGLYPEHHGMVENDPYDRELGAQYPRETGPTDPFWWRGEPIWITAEKQGVQTSIMFWLGSEVEFDGLRPTRWSPYEHNKPYQERVDEVLAWFDGPAETQPRFAAVYFDRVDTAGHFQGPDSEAAAAALFEVDGYVGQLVDGLSARGLLEDTTIIIVSDHGMVAIDEERSIDVGPLLDLDQMVVPQLSGPYGGSGHPYLQIYGEPEIIESAYAALKDHDPHIKAWKRDDMPAHYHFDHPTRGPDLFVLAEPGWSLRATDFAGWRPLIPGNHGYDNHDPSMAASFVGAGPIFPEGQTAAPFENVNVYLMIACALGLDPAETDGDPAVVEQITGGHCPAAENE